MITHQKINLSSFCRGFYPGSTTVSRIVHGTQAGYLFRLPNSASSPASTRKKHWPVPFSLTLSSHFVCRSAESPEDRIALLLHTLLGTSLVANNAATLTPSLYRWFQLQVAWTLWKRSTISKPDISVHKDFMPARERLTTHVDSWSSPSAPHPQRHKTLSLGSPEISLLCCARAYEGFRPPIAPHFKAALKVRWLYHTTRT